MNPWYRGHLTTPRNHSHTSYKQWATSLCMRTWFFTQLLRCMSNGYNKEKNTFLRPDNIFGRFRPPKRKTQLSTNHPRVLIPKFGSSASDRKVTKNVKTCYDISMKTPQPVNEEVNYNSPSTTPIFM